MRAFHATYRLQLHSEFGFDQAAAIVPYLRDLGISHIYCSPYLQAAPGSRHGYDVVDPRRVNEELGGAQGHERLVRALAQTNLGQVLDVVPNHMAIAGSHNAWWWDVLENGPSSRYASFFDVDWDPPEQKLRNLVLLPILGDHYGRVVEAGEIVLEREAASFSFRYHEHRLPVAPRSLDSILGPAAEKAGSDDLAFISASYSRLPGSHSTDLFSVSRRHRDKEVLRTRLAQLLEAEPELAAAVDAVVAEINADPDLIDSLLERQNYRVARWRTGGWELSYRRFFDIDSLAALRIEEEHVFEETHALILKWVRDGILDGLRIDHPDGLRDPEGYFQRLRERSGTAWIVAEKILEPGEVLPPSWAIDGTTGYDFMNRAAGLFIDPAAEPALTRLAVEFTGESIEFSDLVQAKKHLVMTELLGSDMNRLTELFVRVCERHRRHRDHTRPELNRALSEFIACLPVYRTYIRPISDEVSEQDRAIVEGAIAAARERAAEVEPELFDFLRSLLLLEHRGEVEDELVERLQQTSGPVMAKGVEDTAFYCDFRLVALNEVGGDPGGFGVDPQAFHAQSEEANRTWPRTMLASSTHDTKRSEDVRARIAILSELPEQWAEAVRRWSAMNERHRTGEMPDRGAEYLLYQTLVGAHPIDVERAAEYMQKATKEAKSHTSWTNPDPAYDAALRRFVEGVLGDMEFCADLERFAGELVAPGRVNSLAFKLLTLTAPGIPDLYQGSELWDLSLVDPDNRRPVDFEIRRRLLAQLPGLEPEQIMARSDQGLPKLHVVRQALALRGRRPELFQAGASYEPRPACGEHASRVVAFIRGGGAMTVVPRLTTGLEHWGDTRLELPEGLWLDRMTGSEHRGQVAMGALLGRFPVALLVKGN